MAKLYAVILEPFRPTDPISENLGSSKENRLYAIISESSIILTEESPIVLGYRYQEWNKKEKERLYSRADVLSYTPPGDLLCTPKGAFRIKNLGQLFIRDFEKGLVAEANRHD